MLSIDSSCGIRFETKSGSGSKDSDRDDFSRRVRGSNRDLRARGRAYLEVRIGRLFEERKARGHERRLLVFIL